MGIEYRRKPTYINAIQFEGGVDNATRIIEWIGMETGRAVAWIPKIPAYFTASGKQVTESEERLIINPGGNNSILVPLNYWVTRDDIGFPMILSPDEFERDYESV